VTQTVTDPVNATKLPLFLVGWHWRFWLLDLIISISKPCFRRTETFSYVWALGFVVG
jgi:hypothetical protein